MSGAKVIRKGLLESRLRNDDKGIRRRSGRPPEKGHHLYSNSFYGTSFLFLSFFLPGNISQGRLENKKTNWHYTLQLLTFGNLRIRPIQRLTCPRNLEIKGRPFGILEQEEKQKVKWSIRLGK